jgi:hypothetical protein
MHRVIALSTYISLDWLVAPISSERKQRLSGGGGTSLSKTALIRYDIVTHTD